MIHDCMHQPDTFTPPMRDGITASIVFLPKSSTFITIFDFVVHKFPHISQIEWQQRFDDHLVFDQQGTALNITSLYSGEQHIYYYRHLTHETKVPFSHKILFENDHFMLVDKPHFLTVSPTGQYVQQTLLTRLKKQSNNPVLTPIHRLDRETAGLILISKQVETRGIYQQLFAERQVQKIYHAIAPWQSNITLPLQFSARMQKGEPFYTMQIVKGDSNSSTYIDVLEHNQHWAKYQLSPITGKQHQLRVHMAALGLPLKNDRFYPKVQHNTNEDFNQPLQLLAKHLSFVDPINGESYNFSSGFDLMLSKNS